MRLFATDDQLLQVDPNHCLTQATSLRTSPHVISNNPHDRPNSHQSEYRTVAGPVNNNNVNRSEFHVATGVANVAQTTHQSEYHMVTGAANTQRRDNDINTIIPLETTIPQEQMNNFAESLNAQENFRFKPVAIDSQMFE